MTEATQREEAIFEAALQLPPDQRAEYLAKTCGEDAPLHRRIEELLRGHERVGGALDQSPAAHLRETLHSSAVSEKPGDQIGHYKLLQQIGEGGCGAVYMAEQQEPVRRRVALKVIKLGMDTRQVIARFEAERQALALMDHPNIAKVLDAGATGNGRPYFVMELVRGIKITDYCDAQNLSAEERLKLFAQICQAIQHAHQKGVIHRDIKPSNILVADHDGVLVPKVIDFGIAKATTDQRLTDKTLFTAFEQFIGTPAYMSPEQANLSGLDIDTRTDIYSLGVLLYELLTGKTPFDAKELLQSGFDEMRRTIREKDPIRPSTRLSTMQAVDLTATTRLRQTAAPKLIHLVRGDLDWIVMKCLEKDRTRRYETANGLAMDVQRFLQHEPVLAGPPTNWYRFKKLVRRNRLAFAAASAITLAVIFGLAGILWQWRRAEHYASGEHAQREIVEGYAARGRLNLYAGDIGFAARALQRGNLGLARQTLTAWRPQSGESDLRGFEWRHLWDQCQGDQLATLTGHDWIVTCAAFSPDGKYLATGGQDQTVKVWDVARQEMLASLHAATGAVWSVTFTPDARFLVTSGRGGTRFWESGSWQIVTNYPGQFASLSRAGTLLAVSEANMFYWWEPAGPVAIWNYSTGEKIRELPKPGHAATLSPDGKTLAVADRPSGIDLWDVESMKIIRTLNTSNTVWSIRFSADGKQLVTVAGQTYPSLWDLTKKEPPRRLPAHQMAAWAAVFSPDDATLATASSDQTVRLWNSETFALKNILRGHEHEVWCVAFSPDGQLLATGGKDANVMLWSGKSRRNLDSLSHQGIYRFFFSPDGSRIATVGRGAQRTLIWTLRDGPVSSEIPGRSIIGFSPDGKSLVRWAANSRSLDVLSGSSSPSQSSAPTHVPLEQTDPDSRRVTCEGFSSDWKTFFVMDEAGRIGVWETTTGRQLHKLQGPLPPISNGVISHRGRFLAIGAQQETAVRFYDLTSGRKLEFQGHRDTVRGLAFSPDETILASGSLDGTIRLWETRTGKAIATLPGHMEETSDVAFSPDGRTLASVNVGLSVKLWHVATRRELLAWEFPAVSDYLQFSPDGRFLAVLTKTNSVQLFEAPTTHAENHTRTEAQAGEPTYDLPSR